MYFTHKKSKITGWWVAEEGTVLTFANICSDKPRGKKMKIVGYLKDSSPYYPELATSTNYVVKVTKKGVITSKGTCYPFREAHALYLEFLSQANKENTLIATDWELNENTMIASIISNGEVKENITFDFNPYGKDNVVFLGYSKKLNSDIVVSTFDRRNVCAKLCIPDVIKNDIRYNAKYSKEETRIETIKKIRRLL